MAYHSAKSQVFSGKQQIQGIPVHKLDAHTDLFLFDRRFSL